MLKGKFAAVVTTVGLFLLHNPLASQSVSASGNAYVDDGGMDVFLARVLMSASGTGIRPAVSVDGYLMTYDSPLYNRGHTIAGITPSAGVSFVFANGHVGGRVGYTAITEPNSRAGNFTMYVPLEKGVTATGDFRFHAGVPRLQGFVQYFSGGSMLVADADAHAAVAQLFGFSTEIGADLSFQSMDDVSMWTAGPSLQLVMDNVALGFGAGIGKRDNDEENRTYVRFGVSYLTQ